MKSNSPSMRQLRIYQSYTHRFNSPERAHPRSDVWYHNLGWVIYFPQEENPIILSLSRQQTTGTRARWIIQPAHETITDIISFEAWWFWRLLMRDGPTLVNRANVLAVCTAWPFLFWSYRFLSFITAAFTEHPTAGNARDSNEFSWIRLVCEGVGGKVIGLEGVGLGTNRRKWDWIIRLSILIFISCGSSIYIFVSCYTLFSCSWAWLRTGVSLKWYCLVRKTL